MKSKTTTILTLLLLFIWQVNSAQQRTISGAVTDENNIPLPGVNIIVKGTTTGTQSDFDGNFTISADEGQQIEFSYVGYQVQTITITQDVMSLTINMQLDAAELKEVVVTALGIKREKKALGYAITEIGSEGLAERPTGDLNKILMGKAAGVQVTNASGLSGAGGTVVIRSLASLGNNQPLYIVDGVRFNADVGAGAGFFGTSRTFDMDPNNIENVTVLKGLSATALYGTDGKNGVIIITTKSGSATGGTKKTEITVHSSTFMNEISSLPNFTNERGQGYYDAFYNFFGNWGATFGRPNYGNVDALGQVPHPYFLNSTVFQSAFPEDTRADYKNYQSQENFFRTGVVTNTNVSVNGGTETTSFNMYISNLDDQGFMPGNNVRRTNFSVGGNAKLSNNFTVSSTLNYSTSTFKAPLQSAIYDALFNTPRSINLAGWPNAHPITGEEISFQNSVSNPYWMLNNSGYLEGVNRSYGNIRAVYTFNDKLSATYSYGLDNSVVQRRSHINRGDVFGGLGQLSTENTRTTVTNHTLMLNYNNRFSEEKFGVTLDGGADVFQRKSNYAFASSTNQIQTSVLEHQFFEEHSAGSLRATLNRPGLFTQLIADYKNFIYINASGRVDWTSNFIENSIFYPSVGISFIPTSAFSGLRSDNFNYLKIRAGYATSADFDVPGGSAYPVYQGVDVNTRPFISENEGLIATNSISGFLGNTALEPALLEEYEIGLETKLWKNRISLDAAYFNRITNNLIFSRILDPATGYETTPINVNEFKAWGVELDLSVDVIKNQNITWNVGGNFTSIRTEVTEIDEQFAIASFGTVQNSMIQGQPLRVLTGTVIATDEDGNFLTNGRQYLIGDDPEIIGDPNPDFVTSFFTTFRYKNFSLSANVQWTQGGDIYSATARSLLARGLTTDTDGLNNVGYVLPGINANTGEPNTVIISSGDAYFNEYANGPDVFGIFDATSIRLQELSLRYAFSPKQLERSPFGNLSIAIVGENLYFKAINMPSGVRVDTNTIGLDNPNALGIESQIGPAGRRVGLSIKASF